MKILASFLLFIGSLFYIGSRMGHSTTGDIDTVEVKSSSFKREKPQIRTLSTTAIKTLKTQALTAEVTPSQIEDDEIPSYGDAEPIIERKEFAEKDPESQWNFELKGLLVKLDPEDGEGLYEAYMKEEARYKKAYERLYSENAAPTEEMINELDQISTEKRNEILGIYAEEVNQHLQNFKNMQTRAPADSGPSL